MNWIWNLFFGDLFTLHINNKKIILLIINDKILTYKAALCFKSELVRYLLKDNE